MSQEVSACGSDVLMASQPVTASGYGTDDSPSTDDQRPALPEGKHNTDTPAFVYLLTVLCAIGGFLFGYDTGIISGAIVLLHFKFLLNSVWEEVVVSATLAAAAIFSVLSGFSNNRLGRKPTMLVASVVFSVGALLLAGSQERNMIIIGRFIVGIGVGMYLYISFLCRMFVRTMTIIIL